MRREVLRSALALRVQPQGDGIKRAEIFLDDGELLVIMARGRQRVFPLQTFRGLLVSFSGRSELFNLNHIEMTESAWQFSARRQWSAWYVNELLIRLLPRQILHETLFHDYLHTLTQLSHTTSNEAEETALRRFELNLVAALGYGMDLMCDAYNQPLDAAHWYDYRVGEGAWPLRDVVHGVAIKGESLVALSKGDLRDLAHRRAAKQLMRRVIDQLLNGQPLYTRRLLQQRRRPA